MVFAVALDPGLGPLHHPVSTRNRQAQAYFDQGLKLIFAFNHEAAIRSFQRALELDSDLAMAAQTAAHPAEVFLWAPPERAPRRKAAPLAAATAAP